MCLGCAGIASNGSALRRSVADSVRKQSPVSRSWPFDLPGSGKDIAKDKPDARIRTKPVVAVSKVTTRIAETPAWAWAPLLRLGCPCSFHRIEIEAKRIGSLARSQQYPRTPTKGFALASGLHSSSDSRVFLI